MCLTQAAGLAGGKSVSSSQGAKPGASFLETPLDLAQSEVEDVNRCDGSHAGDPGTASGSVLDVHYQRGKLGHTDVGFRRCSAVAVLTISPRTPNPTASGPTTHVWEEVT